MMLAPEQELALQAILYGLEQVIYLTGIYGTGKTFLHRHIQANFPTLMPGWELFVCAPTGNAASIASVNGNGMTLQSLFGIKGNQAIPKGKVTHLKAQFGRQEDDILANRFGKKLNGGRFDRLDHKKIFIIVDEVMATSAEDLATTKLILQRLARFHGLKYKLLCVGHSVQEINDRERELKERGQVLGLEYSSPAYLSPRWDNGEAGIVNLPGFFYSDNNWVVKRIDLLQNQRQGNSEFGSLLNRIADGEKVGQDIFSLLRANIMTTSKSLPPILDGVTYLTSAKWVEEQINGIQSNGGEVFYPYYSNEGVSGFVEEVDSKSKRLKFVGVDEWHLLGDKCKYAVMDAFESIDSVPLLNSITVGAPVMFRANRDDLGFRNGKRGVVQAIDGNVITVLSKEEVIKVSYIQAEGVANKDGTPLFGLTYMPLMVCKALTTQKAQGVTLNGPTCVLLDGKAKSFKPHSFAVALSRVADVKDLSICITRFPKNGDIVTILNNALVTRQDALDFHNNINLENKEETMTNEALERLKAAASVACIDGEPDTGIVVVKEEDDSDAPVIETASVGSADDFGESDDNDTTAPVVDSAIKGAVNDYSNLGGAFNEDFALGEHDENWDYDQEPEEFDDELEVEPETDTESVTETVTPVTNTDFDQFSEIIDQLGEELVVAEDRANVAEGKIVDLEAQLAAALAEITSLKATVAKTECEVVTVKADCANQVREAQAAADSAINKANLMAEQIMAKDKEIATLKASALTAEEIKVLGNALARMGFEITAKVTPVETTTPPVEPVVESTVTKVEPTVTETVPVVEALVEETVALSTTVANTFWVDPALPMTALQRSFIETAKSLGLVEVTEDATFCFMASGEADDFTYVISDNKACNTERARLRKVVK